MEIFVRNINDFFFGSSSVFSPDFNLSFDNTVFLKFPLGIWDYFFQFPWNVVSLLLETRYYAHSSRRFAIGAQI